MCPVEMVNGLPLELPEIQTIVPRNISEHYGADRVAARYCGIDGHCPPPAVDWTHTWIPTYATSDPEIVREYALLQLTRKNQRRGLTAHQEDALIFQSMGIEAQAAGLPIAYLPEKKVDRRPNSLLVMPLHSQEGHEFTWKSSDYTDVIKKMRPAFSEVVACIHPSCINNGYWVNEFRAIGVEMVTGTHYTDANGMLRIQALLSSFEYVTTNGFGSHIAFAAYCGAKVSIFGPFNNLGDVVDHSTGSLHLPGNAFLEKLLYATSDVSLRRHYPFLYCHPRDAKQLIDWGRREVGHENKISPDALRSLFGWTNSDLLRWRSYGRLLFWLGRNWHEICPRSLRNQLKRYLGIDEKRKQARIQRNQELRNALSLDTRQVP